MKLTAPVGKVVMLGEEFGPVGGCKIEGVGWGSCFEASCGNRRVPVVAAPGCGTGLSQLTAVGDRTLFSAKTRWQKYEVSDDFLTTSGVEVCLFPVHP